jgi:hypothetical protein
MQIGCNDTFSNQEAQERSHRDHGLTTTTSLQPSSFTANEIADVACIQRAPVRAHSSETIRSADAHIGHNCRGSSETFR